MKGISNPKYTECFSTIEQVHLNIVPIINEIAEKYVKLYRIALPIDVNLIVGGFGSNAYIHRQIIPNITFSLEKLSPVPDHLKTIVAHEFGHAAHHIISNHAGIDWKKIQWNSPLVWLNQEGAATHFSRQVVRRLHPSVYFSYNDEGHRWLAFSESNEKTIKAAFAEDYASQTPEQIYREWFSIRGGRKFGYSRLAYYIGDLFFRHQVTRLGEMNAIVAWKEQDFIGQAEHWLYQE